jgi:hypothetical protein
MEDSMGPRYAGILGPLAYILVLSRGLIDGSSPRSILGLAILSLLAFAGIGYLTGRIADKVLWDSLKKQFTDELQAHSSRAKSSVER